MSENEFVGTLKVQDWVWVEEWRCLPTTPFYSFHAKGWTTKNLWFFSRQEWSFFSPARLNWCATQSPV